MERGIGGFVGINGITYEIIDTIDCPTFPMFKHYVAVDNEGNLKVIFCRSFIWTFCESNG
jgi:hypothetical protein